MLLVYKVKTLVLYLCLMMEFQNVCGSDCLDGDLTITRGHRMRGYVIATIPTIGKKQCGKKCQATPGCLSYNYGRKILTCEFNSANTTTTSLVADTEYEYIEIGEKSSQYRNCGEISCSSSDECYMVDGIGPVCGQKYCGNPEVVINAVVLTGDNTIGTTRTYACNNGYVLIGESTISCKPDGTWTTTSFHCKDCGNPEVVINAVVLTGDNTVGTTRTYTCNNGYALIGESTIFCKTDGTWTSRRFECKACGAVGYNYHTDTQTCYKVYSNKISWHNAKQTCENRGEQLIVLGTWSKYNYIQAVIKNIPGPYWSYVSIGAWYSGNAWKWIDGTTIVYNEWDIGEGNPAHGQCVAVMHGTIANGFTAGKMNDVACGHGMMYICEKLL